MEDENDGARLPTAQTSDWQNEHADVVKKMQGHVETLERVMNELQASHMHYVGTPDRNFERAAISLGELKTLMTHYF